MALPQPAFSMVGLRTRGNENAGDVADRATLAFDHSVLKHICCDATDRLAEIFLHSF
jgi:hypothetical protein